MTLTRIYRVSFQVRYVCMVASWLGNLVVILPVCIFLGSYVFFKGILA